MTFMLKIVVGFLISVLTIVEVSLSLDIPEVGRVTKVFDGDTVELESGIKVRYLGIDTPEIAHDNAPADCFGNEAKVKNASLVLGRKVKLRYDENEKFDRYGRLLAYVFLEDGTFINELLLKEGYAFVLRDASGFSLVKSFLEAQRDAIKNKRGLWGHCKYKKEPYYVGNLRSFVFHRSNCSVVNTISPSNRVRFETREEAFIEGYHPCRRCKP
ncbi:MAG: thermonuclease family protein [Syntrophobacterales bacterium]|nr:thermonuclease family protein [Syntrophobacterales bacterium]